MRAVRRAAPRECRRAAFTRCGHEPAAGFEQADVFPRAPAVVRARVDQPGQQRRPQHGVLLGQRVGDRRRFRARLDERHRRLAFDERERHRFGEAAGDETAGEAHVRARSPYPAAVAAPVSAGNAAGMLVEPEMPPDFFDQVRFARDVDAIGRHRDHPPAGRLARGRIRAARSRPGTDAAGTSWPRRRPMRDGAQRNPGRLAANGIAVDHRPDGLAGANLFEQRRRPGDAGRRSVDVATALEADGRFGLQVQAACSSGAPTADGNTALSRTIRVVPSWISESRPPITPATAAAVRRRRSRACPGRARARRRRASAASRRRPRA